MRFAIAFLWLLHWLPLPILGRMGNGLGSLLFRFLKRRRHITLTNLRLCFPDMPESERLSIAEQHFQAYARSVLERGILWWASEARLKRLLVIESPLPLDELNTVPTVVLCPHFVCLDVAGVAFTLHCRGSSMYVRPKNPALNEVLRRGRLRFNPGRLFTRQDGIKPILRAVREGLPYFMLPDMDFGRDNAEFIPFFGNQAATLTALPRIAAATHARVIPVVATFLPNFRGWKAKFYPVWDNFPGSDITAATRRMNAFIEERILEAPAEYFWTHRRFKTRPEGEPDVYNL
ncbi:MAG: lipid A biosynthesis acyltransferase [Burkholderiaceae bacterium]|nr:lipid A biosynthesis acyltransferase [Burkholderiaceae bacterium]